MNLSLILILFYAYESKQEYVPEWNSLDSRPLPSWYDDAKFGLFVQWGLFSVPSFGSEWFWYDWMVAKSESFNRFMVSNFPPGTRYEDFATMFKPKQFDPHQWADLFEVSGAKYVIMNCKHYDGFAMWPSLQSPEWNSMQRGPQKDLLGDLMVAVRNQSQLHFGIYYSLYEWFNILYLHDKEMKFQVNTYAQNKLLPELIELVKVYKPDIIWSDGDWEAPADYWGSTDFLSWLYNESPVKDTVVANDRWGKGIVCHHGGFLTCEDGFLPDKIPNRKWESIMTLDKEAGSFRREAQPEDYRTLAEFVELLAKVVSYGGNLLLTIGPTGDGQIPAVVEQRLRQIGRWLTINGIAIYGTHPCSFQNDTMTIHIWYTCKINSNGMVDVFAIFLQWPLNNILNLSAFGMMEQSTVTFLGLPGQLLFKQQNGFVSVKLPVAAFIKDAGGWVLRFQSIVQAPNFTRKDNRFKMN